MTVVSLRTDPFPRQSGHLSVITRPVPPQSGQTLWRIVLPNMVLCTVCTTPLPLQREQVLYAVPPLAPVPRQAEHGSLRI